jgi:Uncharacterized conserved protein
MIPNSSQAKSSIFSSIRENLAKSKPFDEHGEPSAVISSPVTAAANDVLEVFRASLDMVGAKCAFVADENEAAARLSALVNELSAKNVVISDSDLVYRIVEATGIDAVVDPSREELFSSDVGITSAQWAIAETGTLVLESGAEQHRLISLVPPVHVCILLGGTIQQSMSEILKVVDSNANPTITFVTGASRTSDIELTLAIGVHGPGELYVIVINDQATGKV